MYEQYITVKYIAIFNTTRSQPLFVELFIFVTYFLWFVVALTTIIALITF